MRHAMPFLTPLLLTGLLGCADGDGGALAVIGIVAPNDDCELESDPDFFLPQSEVNPAAAPGLVVTPLLRNQMVDPSQLNAGALPSNDVNVQFAEITLLNENGAFYPINGQETYSVSVSGYVQAGGGQTPLAFFAIPDAVLDELVAQELGRADGTVADGSFSVDLVMTLVGETLAGDVLRSPEHFFSVFVNQRADWCAGGSPDPNILRCAGADDDPAPACPTFGQDRPQVIPNTCRECDPGDDTRAWCVCTDGLTP